MPELFDTECLVDREKTITSKHYLSIRPEKTLEGFERSQVKNSKLGDCAPVEAWTVLGTNRELAYATHGVFRFFGKFPPPIATHLISTYTRTGDVVYDPMCGSGTTGVECLLLNRDAWLFDVNPLSLLLARVKTRRLEELDLRSAVERVEQVYRPSPQKADAFQPVGLRNFEHWFLPKTIESLRGLKKAIEAEPREDLKEFLTVVLASTVRRVSRATTQQGRLFLDVTTAIEDASTVFFERAQKAIKAISGLPRRSKSHIRVCRHDARVDMPSLHRKSTGLVILHPPYFNAYRYSSINSLELSWLGYAHADIREGEVREFFKVGKPEKVEFYIEDMVGAVKNAASLLHPGGVIGLMIGDTILHGEQINVTKMLLDRVCDSKLVVEKIALRVPKFTEATWVASQRRVGNKLGAVLCDYVVMLKRRGA